MKGPPLRRLALLGIAVGGVGAFCNGSHDTTPVVRESCVSCHLADYEGTRKLPHLADTLRFHQTCMDCHAVDGWSPALAGPHPNDVFPIQGNSHDYPCLDCHSLARGEDSEKGANTDCVGCHDGAHSPPVAIRRHLAIPSFQLEEYLPGEPPWCMPCHVGGRGFGKDVPHPEATFPISAAPHDYECQNCHDTSRGSTLARNTNCTGCHDHAADVAGNERDNHQRNTEYVFDAERADFCLDCHFQPEATPQTTLVRP